MKDQTLKDIDRAFKALEEQNELLDRIKAEIEELDNAEHDFEGYYQAISECLEIIDKHIGEQK